MGLKGDRHGGGTPTHQGPGIPPPLKEALLHTSPNFGKTGCPPPTNGQSLNRQRFGHLRGGDNRSTRKTGREPALPKGSPRMSQQPQGSKLPRLSQGGSSWGRGLPQNTLPQYPGRDPIPPGDQNQLPGLTHDLEPRVGMLTHKLSTSAVSKVVDH